MANQPLIKAPNEILHTVCTPFTQEDFDSGLVREVAQDLIDTLKSVGSRGIALAAPQIAVPKCIFVSRRPRTKDQFNVFVNPVLTKMSRFQIHKGEGCLSLDERKRYDVPRYASVYIQFQNLEGKTCKLNFRHMEAFVMQHEMDHLEGLLLSDEATTNLALALKKG